MSDLLLHPAWPLLIAAVLVRVLPRRPGQLLSLIAPVLALAGVLTLTDGTLVTAPLMTFELELLRVDRLTTAFGVVFAVAALLSVIYGLATQPIGERGVALAYAGAAMGVIYAGDLLTLFLFWELKAVTSSFVVLSRRTHRSNRAGMRYLFFHIAGGKLLLGGLIVQYQTTGSLTFTAFESGVAGWLVLAAFALSAGVPPLHAWLKDAYPTASVAGTVFLSAFTTKAAVYALIRGFPGSQVLLYLGVIMATYGVLYAILENDIRRLLSYHIISQVGFMVTAVGIGTETALNGATAHAFAHILYKGLLLMGMGAVLYATGRSRASDLGGILNRMRSVAVLYMIGAVSISSVPLFSGFVSKELIPYAAGQEELAWLVIALKVVSVGTFLSTGLKLPYATFIGTRGLGPATEDGTDRVVVKPVPVSMYVAMGGAAALNIAIGLSPPLLYDLMPTEITRAPYALGPVVEKVQLLVMTVLGFWLLFAMLGSKAKINLDLDWLYRRLPVLISAHRAERTLARADTPASARTRAVTSTRTGGRAVLARVFEPPEDDTPDVVATWTLGGVLLATAALLLIVSLL